MKKIKLKDIANIRTGYQVRSRLTPIDEGTNAVIQMRNISPETGRILENVEFCRVSPKIHSIEKYLLTDGDILLLTRGNNHPAALITEEYCNFVAAGQFMVLSLKNEECLPEYLCWYLNSPECKFYFAKEARGTSVKIIDKNTVGKVEILLPDLDTQKNIVRLAELAHHEEKLLDQLKEKRKRLIYGYCKSKIT